MPLNYDLRREAHAIGEFSASLNFSNQVNVNTFANVVPLLKNAADSLNLPAPMNMQVLNFGIGNFPVQLPTAGSGFQRFASNGEIACSLWCDQTSITLTVREYDRWHNILPSIVKTFSSIAPAYIAEVPAIRSFSLQYLNEFRARDASIRSAAEIFRPQSKWISPFAFESDEPWHCHIGQFIPTELGYRNLVNINCDVATAQFPPEQATRNYAKALILAACHYDLPDVGPLIAHLDTISDVIRVNFDAAHTLEKKLLGEIISDGYLAIMGEGANEH